MIEKTTVRFLRQVSLSLNNDFNQTVKDAIYREIGNMYNNQIKIVSVDDFLHLFKFENLTSNAKINLLENDFKIDFKTMSLDFEYHKDTNGVQLSIKNRDSFKFMGYYRFICFSDYFNLISEDDCTVSLKVNNTEKEFDIQQLKNKNITFEKLINHN